MSSAELRELQAQVTSDPAIDKVNITITHDEFAETETIYYVATNPLSASKIAPHIQTILDRLFERNYDHTQAVIEAKAEGKVTLLEALAMLGYPLSDLPELGGGMTVAELVAYINKLERKIGAKNVNKLEVWIGFEGAMEKAISATHIGGLHYDSADILIIASDE